MMQLIFLFFFFIGCSSDPSPTSASLDAGADAPAPAVVADARPSLPEPAWSVELAIPRLLDPGEEGILCWDLPTPELRLGGWHVTQTQVHHMNVWTQAGPRRETPYGCGAVLEPGEFVLDCSSPECEVMLPVGIALDPARKLTIDLHYLSTSDVAVAAGIRVDLFDAAPSAPDGYPLVLGRQNSTNIQPGETRLIELSSEAPADLDVVSLMGHAHAHNRWLSATVRGVEVYRSENWAEPPVRYYAPGELSLSAGEVFEWSCEIVNDSTWVLQWGTNKVDRGEMCSLMGVATAAPWQTW